MSAPGAKFEVTGWKGGSDGATLGLRFGSQNANAFVGRNWTSIQVELDSRIHVFPITGAFWRHCPEVRGAPITEWLRRHRLAPWRRGQTPRVQMVYLGGNRLRALPP